MKITSKKEALLEHVSIESINDHEISLIVSNKMAEMHLEKLQKEIEKSCSSLLKKEMVIRWTFMSKEQLAGSLF